VHHLTLLIGQRGQERSHISSDIRQRVGLDVASAAVVVTYQLSSEHSSTPRSVFVDQFVLRDREHHCHEGVLVAEKRINSLERTEKDLVGDSIDVFCTLGSGECCDLPTEPIPQPFEPRCLTKASCRKGSGKGGISRPVNDHPSVFDGIGQTLEYVLVA
jgi:hypothetical protein